MAEYCDSFAFSEKNQDHYEMVPNETDSFQFWQGLRGPYYTPFVGEDGYLYWSNTGQLPNPEPVRIVGKDGRGITLTGQCETVAELPEDPDQGEAWAVGEEEPFDCYAWFGEWIDMGLMFPKGDPGQDGHDGQDGVSPEITVTDITGGHRVTITDKDHPAGQTFDVMNGQNGQDGQDGVSPGITITDITGGHTVTITDKDHPAGQSFNVMNGADGAAGPGVPPGGSAGQFYRKASATDYDGEWHTLSAGDSSYDSSLTYSSGTVGQELSSQRNTLNQLKTDTFGNINLTGTNNTGSTITAGTFFYNNGSLVRAKTDIQNGSVITIGTNAETVTAGGLNDLKDDIDDLEISVDALCLKGSKTAISANGTTSGIVCTGLTASHKVCNWGMTDGNDLPISSNNPPADITITENAGSYDITIANFTTAFYIQPTFILPQN